MTRTSLLDTATFWLGVCGAVAVIAGIPLGVGLAQIAPMAAPDPLMNQWFVIGLIGEGLAALALLWALVLYMAHRHNEQERCPDPSAHRTRSRAESAPRRPSRRQTEASTEESSPARHSAPTTSPPSATTPPAPTASAPARAAPVDVDVTPEFLWRKFEGHTDLESQRLIAPYIGKRMTVTGPFDDAASTVTRVQVTFAMQALPAFKSLFMYFNAADWADRIGVLAVGNPITVRGVIERVSRIDIMLDDCELVS